MNTAHPRRAKRLHGHLPGHIRDAFLQAVEVYEETDPGEKLPRIPFQVKYRDRTISIAEACRLVWFCTDTMPGMEFSNLCDILIESPQRQSYAAAARSLLAELKARDEVDAAADAKLKRLYDERDRLWAAVEQTIAAEKGYDLEGSHTKCPRRGGSHGCCRGVGRSR